MNKIRRITFVVPVLIVLGMAATVQPVSASVVDECRQEAEDYGVMPELRDEYINGCIDSRGGASTPSSVEEDYVQPSESDDASNSGVDIKNVAE